MGPTVRALHDPVQLTLAALAVFRMTRLVVEDEVTRRPRERLTGWAAGTAERRARPGVSFFVTCPWCVSFWLAVVWVAALILVPTVALGADAVLALSAVAGLLSSWE
jgi:hypothetical protein